MKRRRESLVVRCRKAEQEIREIQAGRASNELELPVGGEVGQKFDSLTEKLAAELRGMAAKHPGEIVLPLVTVVRLQQREGCCPERDLVEDDRFHSLVPNIDRVPRLSRQWQTFSRAGVILNLQAGHDSKTGRHHYGDRCAPNCIVEFGPAEVFHWRIAAFRSGLGSAPKQFSPTGCVSALPFWKKAAEEWI